MPEDTRNIMDEFKHQPHDMIVQQLNERGVELEIAIENVGRDYNMGTIVRSANAFGVRTVHVIGSRQWNKRGAMATDKYLRVTYHASVAEFVQTMRESGRRIIAVDNVQGALNLSATSFELNDVLVFGAEGPGICAELREASDALVAIEQLGSTRSINVGVAAGIVMYEWLRQNKL